MNEDSLYSPSLDCVRKSGLPSTEKLTNFTELLWREAFGKYVGLLQIGIDLGKRDPGTRIYMTLEEVILDGDVFGTRSHAYGGGGGDGAIIVLEDSRLDGGVGDSRKLHCGDDLEKETSRGD